MTDSRPHSGTQDSAKGSLGARVSPSELEDADGAPVTSWTITVPAPYVKPVRKRKTGKVFQRQPFLNSNDRDSWRVTTPIKNGWIANAITAATEADLPKGLAHVHIDGYIIKPHHASYDAMNYYPTAKALVDGLTRYGLTADDSNKYVTGPFLHEGGKGPAAVIITISQEESA